MPYWAQDNEETVCHCQHLEEESQAGDDEQRDPECSPAFVGVYVANLSKLVGNSRYLDIKDRKQDRPKDDAG